jgi:hypothetical protein
MTQCAENDAAITWCHRVINRERPSRAAPAAAQSPAAIRRGELGVGATLLGGIRQGLTRPPRLEGK